jgi:hypothetical protein
MAHVDPDIHRSFCILAATLGITHDLLLHEAIFLLFQKYNEPKLSALLDKIHSIPRADGSDIRLTGSA